MNRKLILIANSGKGDNYLPAVALDLRHYEEYFKSAEGGAWTEKDIKRFDNDCTLNALKKAIDDTGYHAYIQIVFCGHGYVKGKDTILELNPYKDEDCSVSILEVWLKQKRALLIADSCRKVYKTVGSGIQDVSQKNYSVNESYSDSYFQLCRRIFEQQLDKLSIGYFAVGYACSLDECAHDYDNFGGLYSTSLLGQAIKHIKQTKIQPTSNRKIGYFSQIHDEIIDEVNRISNISYREPQNPQRELGELIPFYIVPSLL